MENVDKTIDSLCEWIQQKLESNALCEDSKRDVAEMTKALAELVSARAKIL